EIPGDLLRFLFAVDGTVATRKHRHAGLLHGAPGARFVAEQTNDFRRRSDELDVAGLAHLGEVCALGEKPVARMNRVSASDFRGADHRRNAQIAVAAPRWTNADVLVRKSDMKGILVRLGVDGDRLDSQLP